VRRSVSAAVTALVAVLLVASACTTNPVDPIPTSSVSATPRPTPRMLRVTDMQEGKKYELSIGKTVYDGQKLYVRKDAVIDLLRDGRLPREDSIVITLENGDVVAHCQKPPMPMRPKSELGNFTGWLVIRRGTSCVTAAVPA
jgi:hypothetical protein